MRASACCMNDPAAPQAVVATLHAAGEVASTQTTRVTSLLVLSSGATRGGKGKNQTASRPRYRSLECLGCVFVAVQTGHPGKDHSKHLRLPIVWTERVGVNVTDCRQSRGSCRGRIVEDRRAQGST